MRTFLFSLLIVCVAVSGAWAKEIVLDRTVTATDVTLIGENLDGRAAAPSLVLECTLGKLFAEEIETPKGPMTQIFAPRFHHTGTIGGPALPVMNRLVQIPMGAELEIKVLESDVKDFDMAELGIETPLYPRQPSHPKDGTEVPFVYEEGAYMHRGFQQPELVTVQEIGQMRHMRLALVTFSPVAYDHAAQKLRVNTMIRAELVLKGSDVAATIARANNFDTNAFNTISRNVIKPAALQATAPRGAQGLLIAADRMFEKDLAPFIAWKKKQGFALDVVYTDAFENVQEGLKAYIQKAFDTNKPAPAFVLFVGDHEQIPAFRGKAGSHISDLYYACTAGNDNVPDIIWGRFSAQNSAELAPQLAKTLEYEQAKFADPSFLEEVVLIAGWDYGHTVKWGYPQIKYGLKYYFNKANGITTQHNYLSAGSHQGDADIRKDVNDGCAFVNYTAHGSPTSWGDPSFSSAQVTALENKGKYPLVVGNCCLTNKFEVSTCFGEAWLRAKNGAIGYIGGTNSTYWDEDLWWGTGFYPINMNNPEGLPPEKAASGAGAYDNAFDGPHKTAGGMVLAGNLAVEESSSPRKLYYWEVYQLMGDPTLMVFWGKPKAMTVEHPKTLAAKAAAVTVNAPAGAYVGVTVGGELIGAGFANADGKAELALVNVTAGQADVVVTGQNFVPYTGTIAIQ